MKKKIVLIILSLSGFSLSAQWLQHDIGTTADLNGVHFVGNDYGWVVGSGGAILHTSDGGENWYQQFCETTNKLNSVYFINPENGWIPGNNGILLHTENGGITGFENYNPAARFSVLKLITYPNPCSGSVTFKYELNEDAMVILEIFNHHGQCVDRLLNERKSRGVYNESWYNEGCPPGVYLVSLHAEEWIETIKLVVMR